MSQRALARVIPDTTDAADAAMIEARILRVKELRKQRAKFGSRIIADAEIDDTSEDTWLALMRQRGWPLVDRATFLRGLGITMPDALTMDATLLLGCIVPEIPVDLPF